MTQEQQQQVAKSPMGSLVGALLDDGRKVISERQAAKAKKVAKQIRYTYGEYKNDPYGEASPSFDGIIGVFKNKMHIAKLILDKAGEFRCLVFANGSVFIGTDPEQFNDVLLNYNELRFSWGKKVKGIVMYKNWQDVR